MVTAEELTVAIRSEGVGETRQDLEGVESAMEDTADSAGASADELEGFSERFAGAMQAAVAALAIGAAGLLANVPVLGEAFSGLGAIVSALAFQMDGVLRPVMSPLTGLFFGIANAIYNADGAFGALIGAVTTIIGIAATLIPIVAQVGSLLGTWSSVGAGVVAILGKITAVIGTVVGAILGLPAALVAAVAAIVAFAAAYALNLGGVRDKTNEILGKIWGFFTGLASDLGTWASDLASDAFDWGKDAIGEILSGIQEEGGVWGWFTSLASDLSEWASGLAEDTFEWGKNAINGLLDGIKNVGGGVWDWFTGLASGLVSWASNLASDAMAWGANIIQGFINGIQEAVDAAGDIIGDITEAVGVDLNFDDVPDFGDLTGDGGSTAANTERPDFSQTSGTGTGSGRGSNGPQIDGRQLSESTGRYRADPGRRRGL